MLKNMTKPSPVCVIVVQTKNHSVNSTPRKYIKYLSLTRRQLAAGSQVVVAIEGVLVYGSHWGDAALMLIFRHNTCRSNDM